MLVFLILMFSTYVAAQPDPVFHCPRGILYPANSYCLEYFSTKRTFDDARSACQGQGGELVWIRDQQIAIFINDIMGNDAFSVDVWHGVHDTNSDGVFTYTDGSSLEGSPFFFNSHVAGKDCMTRVDVAGDFWSYQPCSSTFSYVCQFFSIKCPPTFFPDFSAAVCNKVVTRKRKSFTKAREFCIEYGGDLASNVGSPSSRDAMMKRKRHRGSFWVGVHDPADSGNFQTLTGPFMDGEHPPWARTSSQTDGNNHLCAMMKKGKLYTKNCSRRLFFICEASIP